MKDRIRQIMDTLKMTQQEFSDYIGLSPATLSGIFNGRNRPTLNVVEALKKKIPNISVDWLVFGSGEMYVPSNDSLSAEDHPGQDPASPTSLMFDFDQQPSPTPQNDAPANYFSNSVKTTPKEIVREEVKIIDKHQRRVMEIRVFYDDQTWETFVPQKK